MTIIYDETDLKPESRGKLINQINLLDIDEDVRSAHNSADLVWFERSFDWGTQRRMLKHRNGLFIPEIILNWR